MPPLTLFALSQFDDYVTEITEYHGRLIVEFEKLANWLLPEATARNSSALVTIPKVVLKLLHLISLSDARNSEQFHNDRKRLVNILRDCFVRHSELPDSDLTVLLSVAIECGDKRLRVRSLLLETCTGTFLSYASVKHESAKAKQVLEVLNQFLLGSSRELRCSLRERFAGQTKALVNYLLVCGDYPAQEAVLEALTRLAPANVREKLVDEFFGAFPAEAKEAFVKFGRIQFEIEMQIFLNAINEVYETQVKPCLCHRLIYNNEKMYKSSVQEELVVNFSLGSKLISFIAVREQGPIDDESNPLLSVEIRVSSVKEAALVPIRKYELLKVLTFTYSDDSTKADAFVLMVLQEVETDVLLELLGSKLKFRSEDISFNTVQFSQTILDLAKTPETQGQQNLIKTPSPANSISSPLELKPLANRAKNRRQLRDYSPGNSTYEDYKTTDSDEDQDKEKGLKARKATPLASNSLPKKGRAATPLLPSKSKLGCAFQALVDYSPASDFPLENSTTPGTYQQTRVRFAELPGEAPKSTLTPTASTSHSSTVHTPDRNLKRLTTPEPRNDPENSTVDLDAIKSRKGTSSAGQKSALKRSLDASLRESEEDEMPLSMRIAAAKPRSVSKRKAKRAASKPRKPLLRGRRPAAKLPTNKRYAEEPAAGSQGKRSRAAALPKFSAAASTRSIDSVFTELSFASHASKPVLPVSPRWKSKEVEAAAESQHQFDDLKTRFGNLKDVQIQSQDAGSAPSSPGSFQTNEAFATLKQSSQKLTKTKIEVPAEDIMGGKKSDADVTAGHQFNRLFPQDDLSSSEAAENDWPGNEIKLDEDQSESGSIKNQPTTLKRLASMVKLLANDSSDALQLEIEKNQQSTEQKLDGLHSHGGPLQKLRAEIVRRIQSEVEQALAEEKARLEQQKDILAVTENIKRALEYLLAAQASFGPNKRLAKIEELAYDLASVTNGCDQDAQIYAQSRRILEESHSQLVEFSKGQMEHLVSSLHSALK